MNNFAIRLGLKKAVWFPLIKDLSKEESESGVPELVYGQPLYLPKVQSLDYKPSVQEVDIDADDNSDESIIICTGAEGSVQRKQFAPSEQIILLGEKTIDGINVSTGNDIAPYGALGFKAQLSDGSYLYQFILKTKFGLSDFKAETKGKEKLTPQPDTMTFKSNTRSSDNAWRFYVVSSDPNFDDTFFTVTTLQKLADAATQTYTNPIEVEFVTTLPATGAAGKLYINTTDDTSHYWNGSAFVQNGASE